MCLISGLLKSLPLSVTDMQVVRYMLQGSSVQRGYRINDYYNLSWGQIIARKYGSECLNLSKGGLTTRTCLTDLKGLPEMLTSDTQQLYMCALGHNDEVNSALCRHGENQCQTFQFLR